MPDKEKEEKKLDNGAIVSYELKPLAAASTPFYTVWSVEKVYIGVEFKAGQDMHRAGFNFVPSYGHEVRVAMPNKAEEAEPLPEGTISQKSFEHQFTTLADSITSYRKRILADSKEIGF